MAASRWLPALLALLCSAPGNAQDEGASGRVVLTAEEIAFAHEFSPLPDPPPDPTNAVADDQDAARLGQALFFDTRFSSTGTIACSTCHVADLGWSDGRQRSKGLADLPRHAMTLWNVAYNRWFFWDGRKDTLWSQALDPIENPSEHGSSRLQVAHVLAGDPEYREAYQKLFGALPELDDGARFPPDGRPVPDEPEHPHAVAWDSMDAADQDLVNDVYANFGKSVAAFERRIVSRRAPFDVFVEGLADGDADKLGAISQSAQRGFGLFVGKGQCFICHDGPNFTDLEFHANRAPDNDMNDPGRAGGIRKLYGDPFNTRSRFVDDGGRTGRTKLSIAPRTVHFPGEFKTPTLRNVARSAPYMRVGQLASLADVVHFYSTLENAAPPDESGERLIQPRNLTAQEQADLVAFLESLTDEGIAAELRGPPGASDQQPQGR